MLTVGGGVGVGAGGNAVVGAGRFSGVSFGATASEGGVCCGVDCCILTALFTPFSESGCSALAVEIPRPLRSASTSTFFLLRIFTPPQV
ncbi:hypothetical protein PSI15_10900 [Xenorhabdus sp. PR6a]|nr:hypothetical protein [Xenorhabdus sp. PR6a]